MPLCTIFDRLRAEFGALTRMDILKNKCAASEPYVHGTRIIDYINVHLRIHRIAASNGQPINEVDKVTAFIDGITPCGLFKDCINAFFVAHPDVPTQLFSTLASDVRKCASNLEPDATSASHGFAAAVATNAQHGSAAAATTAATPFLSPADIAVIVQALQHVQPRNNQRQQQRLEYGEGYHRSDACKNPRRGHDISATWSNRKGGRQENKRHNA